MVKNRENTYSQTKPKDLNINCYFYNDMVKKITILEPFLSKPYEKLHLADISRETNTPHPTTRQWLNALEKKGVLKKEHKGRLTLYSLNLENQNILDYLVIAEKNKLIRKCEEHIILGELISNINSTISENVKFLIFGSAVESFNAANDIDILVVGKTETKLIEQFAKRLNKKLHIIQVSSLKKISKALKIEIIKKHLLIKGSEEFVGWMIW